MVQKEAAGWVATAAAVMLLIGAGCTPLQPVTAPQAGTIPGRVTPTGAATASAVEEEATVSPANAANPTAAEQATADLAQRLSVEPAQIEVVEVQDVAWPDASLGCPEPGMMYAQVVTPGMRIILAVAGEEYTYHAGRNRAPFLCENPLETDASSASTKD